MRIHDLRHTFASGGLLVGDGLAMIGKLLGDTQVQTTARYAHVASDPIKQAATRMSDRLASALFGAVDEPNAMKTKHSRSTNGNDDDDAEALESTRISTGSRFERDWGYYRIYFVGIQNCRDEAQSL